MNEFLNKPPATEKHYNIQRQKQPVVIAMELLDRTKVEAGELYQKGYKLLALPVDKYLRLFPELEKSYSKSDQEHIGPAGYHASDQSLNFALGVATLNKAKKADKSLNDACNKAISDAYIRIGFAALDATVGELLMIDAVGTQAIENTGWHLQFGKDYLEKAARYWGANKAEIYKMLQAKTKEWEQRIGSKDMIVGEFKKREVQKGFDDLLEKYK